MGRVPNSPHLLDAPPCDYTIVIPTKGRWREACVVNPLERKLKNVREPFLLMKTLSLLDRQLMSVDRVTLFVNSTIEQQSYRRALGHTRWSDVNIVVGVDGILEQRNFIQDYYPVGTYIVSLDDDLEQMWFKASLDAKKLEVLPPGALEKIIFDAMVRMKQYDAYIWGFNVTSESNVRNIHPDGLSSRNGEVNGFLYGFRNRHLDTLKPRLSNAIEDAERSVRYFAQDGIVLRYLMYVCSTKCYRNGGGLQELFGQKNMSESLRQSNLNRKMAELAAANKLHQEFPELIAKPHLTKEAKTLVVTFVSKGGRVIPNTTEELLRKARMPKKKTTPKKPVATTNGVDGTRTVQQPSCVKGFAASVTPSRVGEVIYCHKVSGSDPRNEISLALNGPKHVFLASSSNSMFIADTNNGRVLQCPLSPSSSSRAAVHAPHVVASNSPGSTMQLQSPSCCAVDPDTGALFVCDTSNHRVLRYDTYGGGAEVVAGGNGCGDRLDQLAYPTHVCCSYRGSMLISDAWNKRVVCWPFGAREGILVSSPEKTVPRKQPNAKDRSDRKTPLAVPFGLCHSRDMRYLYVVDGLNHRVLKYRFGEGTGEFDVCAGGNGDGCALNQLSFPTGIAVDDTGNMYIADENNHRVVKWPSGAVEGTVVAGGNGFGDSLDQLWHPSSVVLDNRASSVNVLVADTWNHRVMRYNPEPGTPPATRRKRPIEVIDDSPPRNCDENERKRSATRRCNIAGCSYAARGRVCEDDSFGEAGARCTPHGGRLCAVPGCRRGSMGTFIGTDEYGSSGQRCQRHGGGMRGNGRGEARSAG